MKPWLIFLAQLKIIEAILDNGDANTLQAFCVHYPDFASFSIDYHGKTFLTKACARPPEKIVPVLHVLLDNGADVNDGLGPFTPLYAAINSVQPLEIIDKIVQNGAGIYSTVVHSAIQKERLDVLLYLLWRNQAYKNINIKTQDLTKYAQESDNKGIIAVVERFVLDQEAETARRERKGKTKGWKQV
ncbi:hypothetical protein B7463_g10572, partial [Scytalidium lignicola]